MSKINPASKLLILIIYLFFIIIASSLMDYLILALGLLAVVIYNKLNLVNLFRLIRYLAFFTSIMLIYNIFILDGGILLVDFHGIQIYSFGVVFTARIFVRVLLMVTSSYVALSLLDNYEFSKGLEYWLRFLKIFKIDPSRVSTTLMIAIMFVPILNNEFNRIIKAQAAKGYDIRDRNVFIKAKQLLTTLLPLFLSAFKRADELAIAMDVKGFGKSSKRTSYYLIKMRVSDYKMIILTILYACLIFLF